MKCTLLFLLFSCFICACSSVFRKRVPLSGLDLTENTHAISIGSISDSDFAKKEILLKGVTFSVEPGKVYVPLVEVESIIKENLVPKGEKKALRKLVDGTVLIDVEKLRFKGAHLNFNKKKNRIDAKLGPHKFSVVVGVKKVKVDLTKQRLFAWQGGWLLLESRISSGRRGSVSFPVKRTIYSYKIVLVLGC